MADTESKESPLGDIGVEDIMEVDPREGLGSNPHRIKVTVAELRRAIGPDRRYPSGRSPFPDEPHWRILHLYGIVGWMSSWYLTHGWTGEEEIATVFSGYFKYNPKDHLFIGHTGDIWGEATIEGELKNNKLTFEKTYVRDGSRSRPPITYTYDSTVKDKGVKIWKGHFRMDQIEGGIEGLAECALTKFHSNAFGIMTGPNLYNTK